MMDIQSTPIDWASVGIGALGAIAVCWATDSFLTLHSRLRNIRKNAEADRVDHSVPPPSFTREQLDKLPTIKGTARLNPRQYVMVEVDKEVRLSVLARALNTQGLVLSNTERSTLRLHRLSDAFQPLTYQDEDGKIVSFPLPGGTQAS